MSEPGLLPISETFVSVQGEGSLSGTPSWFVRLGGCNLRCAWCDTPYASWKPEGAPRSVRDLLDEAAGSRVAHAVVTGGEPLLFSGCADLCRGLRDAGLHVTIETAGTVWLDAPSDLMSVSPKLANSAPAPDDPRDPGGSWRARHEARRERPDVAARLLASAPARQVKFVVRGEGDLPEIDALLARLPGVRPHEVFLMPEGVVAPAPALRDWTLATCRARGWRYGHRLHIELFGNRRGT